MLIGGADDRIEALGRRQHAHHGIFGDRNSVDAGAVGYRNLLRAQEIERERIEAGVDRRDPFEPRPGGANRLRDLRAILHIDPGDVGVGDPFLRLMRALPPIDRQAGGEVGLDERTGERGQNGFHRDNDSAAIGLRLSLRS